MAKINLSQIIGWYGVFAILCGYILISFAEVPAQSYLYQGLMFSGSVGIVLVAYQKKDHQPLILNLIFATIAAVSLYLLALK